MPNGSVETNLFEDTSPSGSEAPKSTKDSILALYGGQQKQQQFNVPGMIALNVQGRSLKPRSTRQSFYNAIHCNTDLHTIQQE